MLEANDGEHALQVAQAYPGEITLLLTDVVMPRMGSRQLADRLVTVRPSMKVLFMSGYTDNALFRHDRPDTEVEFLHKPFTPTALTSKVRKVLDT